MTPPPTSIDGTDITGATIDGTEVQEITVDGQTVFSAGIPDSALTQDLVAWYRFEDGDARDYASSSEFPSVSWGDSTSYDGTVNGATFQSSGGVTDFEDGANSGAFEFDGQDDFISFLYDLSFSQMSVSLWAFQRSYPTFLSNFISDVEIDGSADNIIRSNSDNNTILFQSGGNSTSAPITSLNAWHHYAFTNDGSTLTGYIDGNQVTSTACNAPNFQIGNISRYTGGGLADRFVDGFIDDVRYYKRGLSDQEISDIYNATEL
jgi:hypothetical protein